MKKEHQIRRPVDYGKDFHKSGMTLVTDTRSDRYLIKIAAVSYTHLTLPTTPYV